MSILIVLLVSVFGILYGLATLVAIEFWPGWLLAMALLVVVGVRLRSRPGAQLAAGIGLATGFGATWLRWLTEARLQCQPPNCAYGLSAVQESLWGLWFLALPIVLVAVITWQRGRSSPA